MNSTLMLMVVLMFSGCGTTSLGNSTQQKDVFNSTEAEENADDIRILNQTFLALTDRVDSLENKVTENDKNIYEKVNDLDKTLRIKISDKDKNIHEKVNDLDKTLRIKISNKDTAMTERVNNLEESLRNEIASRVSDMVQLQGKINQLQEKDKNITSCVASRVAFTARLGVSQASQHYYGRKQIKYTRVTENIHGDYNPSTGTFTCSEPGVYQFNLHVQAFKHSDAFPALYLNGRPVSRAVVHNSKDWNSASTSFVVKMAKGDTLEVWSFEDTFLWEGIDGSKVQGNTFSGFLVSSDKCLH